MVPPARAQRATRESEARRRSLRSASRAGLLRLRSARPVSTASGALGRNTPDRDRARRARRSRSRDGRRGPGRRCRRRRRRGSLVSRPFAPLHLEGTDAYGVAFLRAESARDPRRRVARLGEVELIQSDEPRALIKAAPVAHQLGVDGGDVLERIGARRVHDMHEEPRALDVPKELFAEAEAAARPLDEPGDVGDDELAIIETRDAQIRGERRERVVGDLRTSARERGEERRLPRVRQAREAHIGEKLQLEVDLPALALAAVLGDARGASRARRETRVAFSTGSAARHDELLAGCGEVRDRLACRAIDHERSWWDVEHPIRTGPSAAVAASARLAGGRVDLLCEAKVGERPELRIHSQDDVAALSAISSVRTTARNMRLAPEGDDAPATVASADHEARAIDEHGLQANEGPRQRDDPKMGGVRTKAVEHPLHSDRSFTGWRDAEPALRVGGEIAEHERATGGQISGKAHERV